MPSALRIVDELSELADVVLAGLSNNEALVYNSSTGKWENSTTKLVINSTAKTEDYTATNNDEVIACDASSGFLTITMPAATLSEGKDFFVKKIDSSDNSVNIEADGTETIDGADIIVMLTQCETIHVVCNGTTWWII